MAYNPRNNQSRGDYRPPPRDYRNDRDRDRNANTRNRNGPQSRDAYRPSSYADHGHPTHHPDGRWNRPPPTYPGPPGVDNYRPPQGDFSFRFDKPAGVQEGDSYRPQGGRNGRAPSPHGDSRSAKRTRGPQDRPFRGPNGSRPFGARPYGGRPWRPFVAAERELLKTDHNAGTEVAFFDTAGGVTYRPLNELSDSDEAEMDISGDEADTADEPSNKRARVAVEQSASDNTIPKWSNPDPYTAIPPEGGTQGKKKDVVQMIRKARVQVSETRTSLPSDAADFISFDFDDSDKSEHGENEESEPATAATPSVAPSTASVRSAHPLPPKPQLPPKPPAPAESTNTYLPYPDPTPSALGSRKRTHDDEIKMPHTRLKKATKMPSGGGIVREWRAKPDLESTPWMVADHSRSANMAVW